MKKSLKFTFGLLGITAILGISISSIVSCSSNSNLKANKSNNSNTLNSSLSNVPYIPYSALSKNVLVNPITNKPSWTYDEAKKYWDNEWEKETSTIQGYQKVVAVALKSYEKDFPILENASFQKGPNKGTTFNLKTLDYTFHDKFINLNYSKVINNPKLFKVYINVSYINASFLPVFIYKSFLGHPCIAICSAANVSFNIKIEYYSKPQQQEIPSYLTKINNTTYVYKKNITDFSFQPNHEHINPLYLHYGFAVVSTYNKNLNFGSINMSYSSQTNNSVKINTHWLYSIHNK